MPLTCHWKFWSDTTTVSNWLNQQLCLGRIQIVFCCGLYGINFILTRIKCGEKLSFTIFFLSFVTEMCGYKIVDICFITFDFFLIIMKYIFFLKYIEINFENVIHIIFFILDIIMCILVLMNCLKQVQQFELAPKPIIIIFINMVYFVFVR